MSGNSVSFSQWLLVESAYGPEDSRALGKLMRADPSWPISAYKEQIFKYVQFAYSGVHSKSRLEEIWKRYRDSVKE